MAKDARSDGRRVTVTAAAARTSGSLVYEAQMVGVCMTDAVLGGRYALAIEGVFEVPLAASAAKGDQVFISQDGNNTVGRAAVKTAIGAGNVYVGRVVGIPGDPDSQDTTFSGFNASAYPAAGNMLVKLASWAAP